MKRLLVAGVVGLLVVGLAGTALARRGGGDDDCRMGGQAAMNWQGRGQGPGDCGNCQQAPGVEAVKVDAKQAKEIAEKYVAENLKGFKVTGVDAAPRGHRNPHYLAALEKDGKTSYLRIDAGSAEVLGLCAGGQCAKFQR